MSARTSRMSDQAAGRFGMFAGVFTPNVLTILGLILFLRIGWVVGQTGLWGALLIVVLANMISLLTGLSLSSIATSMRVRAGGNYYLISRTLGLEIGGAIGIPLYLSQAISIAFYIIGFTESLSALEMTQGIDPRLISIVTVLIFGVISYIGADFALRIQFFILAVLVASIVSFFAGGWGSFQAPLTSFTLQDGGVSISFWTVFAVFFPAVTGIEVGVSMSGDLKNPSRDIPRGTILSIVVTAVVYALVVFWFATHLSSETLINENMAMGVISVFPPLILAGVWASTLSSALGSILAAPRTLQAIALDNVVPRFFANRMGSATEPRVAVLVSTAVAIGIILLGDLDFVAPIISMFFLNTYGMVNLVAGLEKLVGNPSFRPRFKIHWSLSILGAIGCYGAMLLINAPATVIALIITYGIYFVLQRRQVTRTWGDVRSGILFSLARSVLLRLETMDLSIRNWRPNLIVFTGQPHNRQELVSLASWLTRGRGIVTFFQLITGNPDQLITKGYRETAKKNIKKFINERGLEAFAEAEIVPNFLDGALTVTQSHGIGGLEPNSIVMGWSDTRSGQVLQMKLLRRLHGLNKSTLLLRAQAGRGFGDQKKIKIWWRNEQNIDLMLILAYIMRQHRDWRDAEIVLFRIIDNQAGIDSTRASMLDMIDSVRVVAKPQIATKSSATESLTQLLSRATADVDLLILGIEVPQEGEEEAYAQELDELILAAGTVLLVHNAHTTGKRLLDDQTT
ncbi:MAG: amino acid permease [Chloroflexota bacterium]